MLGYTEMSYTVSLLHKFQSLLSLWQLQQLTTMKLFKLHVPAYDSMAKILQYDTLWRSMLKVLLLELNSLQ